KKTAGFPAPYLTEPLHPAIWSRKTSRAGYSHPRLLADGLIFNSAYRAFLRIEGKNSLIRNILILSVLLRVIISVGFLHLINGGTDMDALRSNRLFIQEPYGLYIIAASRRIGRQFKSIVGKYFFFSLVAAALRFVITLCLP